MVEVSVDNFLPPDSLQALHVSSTHKIDSSSLEERLHTGPVLDLLLVVPLEHLVMLGFQVTSDLVLEPYFLQVKLVEETDPTQHYILPGSGSLLLGHRAECPREVESLHKVLKVSSLEDLGVLVVHGKEELLESNLIPPGPEDSFAGLAGVPGLCVLV